MRQEVGRFLVLFKGGEYRVSPRFYLFVCDIKQRGGLMLIKGTKGMSQDIFVCPQEWKDTL